MNNKPSERIVVFVTPAQKRAIASTAEGLGISVSELMRRAVLNFGATSEQVKAASIVDRLRAPREPDALNEALRKVARGTRHAQGTAPTLPVGLVRTTPSSSAAGHNDARHMPSFNNAATPHESPAAIDEPLPDLPPFDPSTATEEEMRNAAEAVARVAAAKAATLAARPDVPPGTPRAANPEAPRPRARIAQEGGRFA